MLSRLFRKVHWLMPEEPEEAVCHPVLFPRPAFLSLFPFFLIPVLFLSCPCFVSFFSLFLFLSYLFFCFSLIPVLYLSYSCFVSFLSIFIYFLSTFCFFVIPFLFLSVGASLLREPHTVSYGHLFACLFVCLLCFCNMNLYWCRLMIHVVSMIIVRSI